MELKSQDVFCTVKNAQDAGVLEMFPSLQGAQGPGLRFFESLQADILKGYDLEKLDLALYHLAPTLHFMADPKHWEPQEFTSSQMFWAVKNLQAMGVFDISNNTLQVPGAGDRFFEYYQKILVEKIGTENLDRLLYTLGQCIAFLASEEAMINVK
ncbi:MAG: hypothetical protein IJ106_08230 [Parasporobacterium sp.]|nr:hypothetical protein [Parasporobacterium sp.]